MKFNSLHRFFLILFLVSLTPRAYAADVALASFQAADGTAYKAAPNQVLVRYKEGRRAATRQRLMSTYGIHTQNAAPQIGVEAVSIPVGETLESFLSKLRSDPDVEFAQANALYKPLMVPTDTHYDEQYYLNASHLNMEPTWDITTGSPTVVVAVLDTGITMTHPDLDGSLWSDGQGAHGATISMDLDGDGSCSGTCEMCPNNTPTDNDNHYHGTHVAGLIGAEVNNTDIVGIAHGAKIMGVKVLGACGTTSIGTSLAIAQGIIFAADSVSASERLVINMSLGGGPAEQVMKDAIDYAINKKNAVIVAATGNDGAPCKINYPAAYDNVISVGATKENDSLAFFSCSGGAIDLVAPGDGVNNGDGVISLNAPAGTSYLAGTSFASPIVAGVAALVRSVNPNLSPIEVNRILDFTADDLGTQGWDGAFGYGRVNALKAVQAARANTTFTSNPGFPGETFPAPNPYRPMDGRTVKFFLPANMGSTDIRIKIMDLLGQEVKTLSGTTEWDGKNADGNYVASGLYIYEVKTSQGDKRGKITVLK